MSIPDPVGATYRLQLSPAFRFEDAASLAPYLADLGITHVYLSPCLQSTPGSAHGYDVVDPTRADEELGGTEGFDALCAAFAEVGLGVVLDIVPNHMAISGPENRWWWDVLENGQSSRFARYFDVDWRPPEERFRDVVLLPILGDHYGRVLRRGELDLERVDPEGFVVRYYEHVLPVAPRSLQTLLSEAAARSGSEELGFLAASLGRLPRATTTDPVLAWQRHRDLRVLRRLLRTLFAAEPAVVRAVDEVVAELNDDPDRLDGFLSAQNWRLARWRVANRELPYRRFFDVSSLIALRVEDPDVFDATHDLVVEWTEQGRVQGLRIDHVDGLRDPLGYLERLRRRTGDAWVVVEKVLEGTEELPTAWPVAGTTGYDFLAFVTRLFVDPAGEAPMLSGYRAFTGDERSFEEHQREAKRLVMRTLLGADLSRLTEQLVQVCEAERDWRDFTRRELEQALGEVAASFHVYRTYVRAGEESPDPRDLERIAAATAAARAARPDLDPELFDFLEALLSLQAGDRASEQLALRFQQFTGPVTAKAVEDTVLYRYVPLLALNDVGCSPSPWSVPVEDFHRRNEVVQERWPSTMLATSTHDTKRAEDVRARLTVLSQAPALWLGAVHRWSVLAARHWGDAAPDRRLEWFVFQTLVGAHPLPVHRAQLYVEKAIREAKLATSWTEPDTAYEDAVMRWVAGVLSDQELLEDLDDVVAGLRPAGQATSLAMLLLRLTAPGVPDTYQGTELWDLSLVDPDNRRPVDFARRRELLTEVAGLHAPDVIARMDEGLPKLYCLHRTLAVRRDRPASFGPGSTYTPRWAAGPRAGHVVAFQRGDDVLVAVPRLALDLADWSDTTLEVPEGVWRDAFTGASWEHRSVPVAELLGGFPVALLVRTG